MRMLRNEVIRVCCFGIEEVIFGFAIARLGSISCPPILSGLQVLLVSVTATVDIVVCFLDFIAAWQCKDHQ